MLHSWSKANARNTDRKDLLSELELMKRLKLHPHVIRLLGCVTETGGLVLYFLFGVCLEYTVGHYNLCVLQRISNVLFFYMPAYLGGCISS